MSQRRQITFPANVKIVHRAPFPSHEPHDLVSMYGEFVRVVQFRDQLEEKSNVDVEARLPPSCCAPLPVELVVAPLSR